MDSIKRALNDVEEELRHARSLHRPMASAHEGYAVILEELDELWEEVRKKRSERSSEKLRQEAVQIAAMALRFITEIADKGIGSTV